MPALKARPATGHDENVQIRVNFRLQEEMKQFLTHLVGENIERIGLVEKQRLDMAAAFRSGSFDNPSAPSLGKTFQILHEQRNLLFEFGDDPFTVECRSTEVELPLIWYAGDTIPHPSPR